MRTHYRTILALLTVFGLLIPSSWAQTTPPPGSNSTSASNQSSETAKAQDTAEKASASNATTATKGKNDGKKKKRDELQVAQEKMDDARKDLSKALEMKDSPEKSEKVKKATKKLDAASKDWAKKVAAKASAKRSGSHWIIWVSLSVLVVLLIAGGWYFAPQIRNRFNATPTNVAAADLDARLRGQMATSVMRYAFGFIFVMVLVVLGGAITAVVIQEVDEKKAQVFFDVAKYVLGVLLPVVAAWVGTVMAFYFGRENFRDASKSMQEIAKQLTSRDKLESQSVEKLGMAIDTATKFTLSAGQATSAVTVAALRAAFISGTKTFDRLPILKSDGTALCCLHSSTLAEYELALTHAAPGGAVAAEKLTLQALLAAKPWLEQKSYGTLPKSGKGSEAQELIGEYCKDVFVTEDGTKQGKVLRWITNVDLLYAAQV